MKGLADVVAMGVKVGILYLRFDQQRSVLLDQGNPLFLSTCSQLRFLHVWARTLHSSVAKPVASLKTFF